MIIYQKIEKNLVIPCGLGPSVCPETGYDLQSKTVDSSIALQTVEPDSGYYGLYRVIVNPIHDDNLLPGNIKNGVEILGVMGTYAGEMIRLQAKTVDASTASVTVTFDPSYDGLSSVTVNPYVLDSKTVDPSTAAQTVISDADGLSSVTVNAATLQNRTIDPSTVLIDVQRTSNDYFGLRHVYVNPVTSDIDPDIQAGNIKEGVEILGVVGTFQGGTLQSKTVNSSTSSQTITPDGQNYGLSSVTVNPYTLDSKTVDSSTVSQTINSSADGLSSVTVNPYTLEAKTQNITQNGTYTVTPTNADGLSSVDISVNVADIPAVLQTKSVSYNQNGEYQVEPDQGYEGISHIDISVNVPDVPPELQSKTVDSSTSSQTVTPDQNYDGLSSVTVNPYVLDSKTVDCSTEQQVITSDADGLSSVTVNAAKLQGRTVTPQRTDNTIYPNASNGYIGFNKVTIYGVTAAIDSDIQPENIKRGVEILGITGTYEGTAINNQNKTVSSSTSSQTVTADSGYTGLGTVTVNPYTLDIKTVNPSTNSITVNSSVDGMSSVTVNAVTASIDPDIQAGNIKKDVEILGVVGTYEGASINNQNKTVNPSTNSQSITADQGYTGLGTVTVNPYTVETNSSTLTANGTYTFTPQDADALSSVTVDVSVDGQAVNNQNKTVNSSTSSQTVTADSGYTGLGTVTVNPYTLDSKTVDPSTSQITVNSSANGLSSVTVNAVTAAIDPDISAGNIRRGVNILGVTGTYDGSSNSNWIMDTKKGVITDLVTDTEGLNALEYGLSSLFRDVSTLNSVTFTNSSASYSTFESVCRECPNLTSGSFPNLTSTGVQGLYGIFEDCPNLSHVDFPELTTVQNLGLSRCMMSCCTNRSIVDASVTFPKLTDVGNAGMMAGFYTSGFSSVSFPVLTRVALGGFHEAFCGYPGDRCVQDVSFPNLAVCDYDYNPGSDYIGAFNYAFTRNDAITSLSFPSLTTGTDRTFEHAFIACSNLTSISLPLFTSPISPNSIQDCSSLVSITANPLAIGTTWLSDSSYFPYESPGISYKTNTNPTLTTVTLTQDASDNISFSGCSALSAATVLHILEHLDLTVSSKTCTFYSNGLFVEDDAQGSIQNAYDAAEDAGWTIINLVIMPHGSTVNYVTSISQPSARNVSMPIPEVYSCDTVVEMDYYCPDTANVDAPIGGYVRSVYMCRIIFNLDVLGGTVIDYDRDGNARTVVNDSYTVGARHTLELDQYNEGTHYQKISVDGSNVATASSAKSTVHDLSNGAYFDLFKIDNSYAMPGFTYYRFKWYEYINGTKTLVHDYKPALDPNNVPGFYDEVTQQYLLPESGTLDYTP